MWYGGNQGPFNEWRAVQIYDKQHARRRIAWKIWSMAKMFSQSFPTGFGKSLTFQLFPRVMSSTNVTDGTVSTSMVIQLSIALMAIMKDQVEQLNKIGAAAMTIGIGEKLQRTEISRLCVKWGWRTYMTSPVRDICLSIWRHLLFCFRYLDLSLHRVWHRPLWFNITCLSSFPLQDRFLSLY